MGSIHSASEVGPREPGGAQHQGRPRGAERDRRRFLSACRPDVIKLPASARDANIIRRRARSRDRPIARSAARAPAAGNNVAIRTTESAADTDAVVVVKIASDCAAVVPIHGLQAAPRSGSAVSNVRRISDYLRKGSGRIRRDC